MSFPLMVDSLSVSDASELTSLVRDDALSPSLAAGQGPAVWVVELVEAGTLDPQLASSLAASLLDEPEPITVTEGARLALALSDPGLVEVMLDALDEHDMTLLLQPDPMVDGASVEDTVLRAAAKLLRTDDPELRDDLLMRLRHAGLPDVELAVLCRWGNAYQLQRWLPAVLVEAIDDAGLRQIAERLAVGDDGADEMRAVLAELRPALLAPR